jgi:hypothetical protein
MVETVDVTPHYAPSLNTVVAVLTEHFDPRKTLEEGKRDGDRR